MKMPCEVVVWVIVPVIKREFAKSLVQNHKLSQRETATILDTTEAAISRYISGKRGVLEITDEDVLKEIEISVKKILKNKNSSIEDEICSICKLIRTKNLIEDTPGIC